MEYRNKTDKMLSDSQATEVILQLKKQIREASAPDDRLHYLLGNAYRKQGDFPQALNCYLEAMSINPESPAVEAHHMLMSIIEFYHKDYYNP